MAVRPKAESELVWARRTKKANSRNTKKIRSVQKTGINTNKHVCNPDKGDRTCHRNGTALNNSSSGIDISKPKVPETQVQHEQIWRTSEKRFEQAAEPF